MNPLSDLGMSDEMWDNFNGRFVKAVYLDENSKPYICPNCTSGEPVSLHHIFIGFDRAGKLIHDYGTQAQFSCFACSMRLAWNAKRRAQGLPTFGDTNAQHQLVEPSDRERSEWPTTTREYVEALEESYDYSHCRPTESTEREV